MRVGVIDMGSNTFNFLVAHIGKNGQWSREFVNSIPVFLGKNAGPELRIREDRMIRAMDAVAIHTNNALNYDCDQVLAFGTAFMRKASNARDLIEELKQRFKIEIRIIDGLKEAEYIHRGTQIILPPGPEPRLSMDIGGGSVEFIIDSGGQILWKQSFETGVSLLGEMHEYSDPLSREDIEFVSRYFEERTSTLPEAVKEFKPRTLIGSAGSFDTMASVISSATGRHRLDDFGVFTKAEFDAFKKAVLGKKSFDRSQIPGMEPSRVHSIPLAAIMIDSVMKKFGFNSVYRTSYAMREGIADALAAGELTEA